MSTVSRMVGAGAMVALAVAALHADAVGAAQRAPSAATPSGEWRTYGADLASTRYSPLDQIDPANFSKLEVAWRFKTDHLGPRPEYNYQSTPLMVGGVLYTTAGSRRAVVALDAATGEQLWMHREDEGKRGEEAPRRLSGRGLSVLDRRPQRRGSLYVTPGYRMIALDAKTGAAGAVLRQGRRRGPEARRRPGDGSRCTGDIGLHAAPIIVEGHHRHRRGAHRGQPAGQPPQRQGLRARLRRADRQAPVDLPHHPAAGRVRLRHLAAGLGGVHRQHRRVGADERRRGAGPAVSARRDADRRLLRRPPPGRRASSARASSRWTSRPASASGTSSSSSTASGTGTCRARRSWPTSSIDGKHAEDRRCSRASRAGCTYSTA